MPPDPERTEFIFCPTFVPFRGWNGKTWLPQTSTINNMEPKVAFKVFCYSMVAVSDVRYPFQGGCDQLGALQLMHWTTANHRSFMGSWGKMPRFQSTYSIEFNVEAEQL